MSRSFKARYAVLRAMPKTDVLMFLEASALLLCASFCVRFMPLRWYCFSLGGDSSEPGSKLSSSIDETLQIRKSISRAVNNVPWRTVCLQQAVAAKWMCRRRSIQSVMYVGVTTVDRGAVNAGTAPLHRGGYMRAHAWLKVRDTFVSGERGHRKFTVLKRFY